MSRRRWEPGVRSQVPAGPTHRKSNVIHKQLITGTHSLENQPSHSRRLAGDRSERS